MYRPRSNRHRSKRFSRRPIYYRYTINWPKPKLIYILTVQRTKVAATRNDCQLCNNWRYAIWLMARRAYISQYLHSVERVTQEWMWSLNREHQSTNEKIIIFSGAWFATNICKILSSKSQTILIDLIKSQKTKNQANNSFTFVL